ncbi:MAG: hypothetical protein HKN32_01370 [Flavobacteriales bacterium]|nr:hypothetical protein [Flavobacteriales bacterium]
MIQDEKEKSSRRVVALLGLGVLFVHFAMTSLYTIPSLPAPEGLKKMSRSYIWPMFHQGWQLFAPNVPGYQNDLFFRAYADGKWTEWMDASRMPEVSNHPRIPYITQKVAIRMSNMVKDPERGVYYADDLPQLDKVEITAPYQFGIFYCRQQYKMRFGTFPDSLQLRLDFIVTPNFFTGKKEVEDKSFTFSKTLAH